MKTTKRLLALLLTLAMLLSLGATAVFADDDTDSGSITVSYATIGETYTIYKLFDATYSGTYTDSEGNTVTPTAYIATKTQYATLSADENCVFDFQAVYGSDGNVSGYQVTVKSGVSGEDVISYIKSLIFSVDGFPGAEKVDSKTAESGTVEFTNLEYGYYFVTSTLGAVVSINTVNPTAEIIDKNPDIPDYDNDPNPEDPEKDVVNSNGDSIDGTTVNVGDTLTYVISWTNTGYYTEDENGTLASVVVKDAAPEGTELVTATSTTLAGNPTFTLEGTVTTETGDDGYTVTVTQLDFDDPGYKGIYSDRNRNNWKDNGDSNYTVSATVYELVTVYDSDGNVVKQSGWTEAGTYKITVSVVVDDDGNVTWTYTNVPKNVTVIAAFDVTVLNTAKENDQNRIDNTANVIVNNTFDLETNEVTNYVPDPSDPSKDVKLVEDGEAGSDSYNTEKTAVGEILQYEITYKNAVEDDETGAAQSVKIEDTAPTGTVYVKNSAAITIKNASDAEVSVTDGKFTYTDDGTETTGTVAIAIDENGNITWTVEKLPENYTVVATFQVEVTEAAYSITDLTIRNTATYTIDDNDTKITNEVENPVPEDEDHPYDPDPGKVIVQADGTETKVNTGSFGDTVAFDLGIDAVNYVDSGENADGDGVNETVLVKEYYIYDKMDPGFTLDELKTVTINGVEYTITKGDTNSTTGVTTWTATCASGTTATFYTTVDTAGYTIINGIVPWTTSTTDSEGNTTYSPLYPNCELHLTYMATINENAVIAGNGNINRFKFSYQTIDGSGSGDEPDPENPTYPDDKDLTNGSEEKTTTTYTYALAIQKISEETGEPLAGATFTLTDNNGKAVYGVATSETGVYNYTSDSTTEGATDQFVTNSDGQIIIKGVDIGTYTFTEIKAPDGYILLTESVSVTATMTSSSSTWTEKEWTVTRTFEAVSADDYDSENSAWLVEAYTKNDDGTFTLASGEYDSNTNYYKLASENATSTISGTTSTVEFDVSATVLSVLNAPGSELPTTGGVGTTLFYIFGAILVLAAGILLVAKRRMRAE